jgi:hypothetical protein
MRRQANGCEAVLGFKLNSVKNPVPKRVNTKGLKRVKQREKIGYLSAFPFFFFVFFVPLSLAQDQGAVNVSSLSYGWVKLAWDPVNDADVAGYKLYLGTASRNYNETIDLGNTTQSLISGLIPGQTYYLSVTAYDRSNSESGFSNEVAARGTSLGDYNLDGNPDLLWWHQIAGAVYIWHMNGSAYMGEKHVSTIGYNDWRIVGVGDFNRDGSMDILWSNPITGAVYLWYMNGSSFIGEQHIRTIGFSDWRIVGVGDFNRDGYPDILWFHEPTGQVYAWLVRDATFLADQHIRTIRPGSGWQIVGVGDFNGDGHSDILWSHPMTGKVYVWYMNGTTYGGEREIKTIGKTDWRIVGVGDFNRDGGPDILWRHQGTGQINVWYMREAAFVSDSYIATIQDLNWKIVGPR